MTEGYQLRPLSLDEALFSAVGYGFANEHINGDTPAESVVRITDPLAGSELSQLRTGRKYIAVELILARMRVSDPMTPAPDAAEAAAQRNLGPTW